MVSINLKRTNYMIVKPQRKKNIININNREGSCYALERKDSIKYFGILIKIPHLICMFKALTNTGVITSKLRHYLHLMQIYYNLIYPYISYVIVALGSTSKTNLQKNAN